MIDFIISGLEVLLWKEKKTVIDFIVSELNSMLISCIYEQIWFRSISEKIILNFRAILSDENVNMLTLNIKFHAFCEAKPNIMQMNHKCCNTSRCIFIYFQASVSSFLIPTSVRGEKNTFFKLSFFSPNK